MLASFDCSSSREHAQALKSVRQSRNKQLKELFVNGFGIHHAGMLRSDRNMVEKYFGKKLIKVCGAFL